MREGIDEAVNHDDAVGEAVLLLGSLAERYAPPSVLLRADGSIRAVHGDVRNYLVLRNDGDPATLATAARANLKSAICRAFESAASTQESTTISLTPADANGRTTPVDIHARPVVSSGGETTYYLLSFLERAAPAESTGNSRGRHLEATAAIPMEDDETRLLLSMRQQQQAAVARVAALARSEVSTAELLVTIAQEAVRVLDVDFSEILEYDSGTQAFLMVAGQGWPEGSVGSACKPGNLGSLAGYTLASNESVIVANFNDDERFDSPFLQEHGAVSGMSVPIGADNQPWGVLGVQSRRAAEFTQDDINYLLANAALLWSAIRRESIQVELQDEQMRTHALLSNSPAFAWMKDMEGRFAYVSPTFETKFGVPSGKWIGASDVDLFPAERALELQRNDRAALDADGPLEFVETLPSADGELSTFMVNKFAFTDVHGQRYVGGVAVDISERVKAEQKLERSRADLQHMIDSATIGIAFATVDGEVLQANDALLDIFSVSREDFEHYGWHWKDTVLPTDRRFADVMNQLGQSASSETIEIRRRDAENETVWVLASAKPLLTDMNAYVAFVVDMTPQKQAELALAASERRFRLAAHTAEFGTYFADLDQRHIVWSRETARLFGHDKTEALTTPIGEAPEFVLERDRLRLTENIRESLAPGGSGRLKVEVRVARPGGRIRWLLIKGRTVFDQREGQSTPSHMAGFVHDITQQKRLEKQLRDARTAAEAANIAKSQFLANMSHEIRTPMTSILGFAEILSQKLDGTEEKQLVEKIHENGTYLCNIIDDVLDLSKIEAGKIVAVERECDIASVIAKVFYSMETRARQKEIDLELVLGSPIPRCIVSDQTMIRQILLNIVGNAIKYTSRGAVTVTVSCDQTARELRFSVRDTGTGIAESRLRRVFEPFEQGLMSGRSNTDGTGLGLSISKRLIETLGGRLKVESQPDKGSIFSFALPIGTLDDSDWLDSRCAILTEYSDQNSTGTFRLPELNAHVLVVDDNEDIRFLVANAIRSAGGSVTTATTGREALQIWHDLGRDVPLEAILMDLRMPVMDGLEATRKLRGAGYSGAIIALTAHAMRSDREACEKGGFDDFIEKPVDRQTLLNKLRQYLDINGLPGDRSREKNARILCVDDSVDTNATQKMLLERRGYRVTTATDADEARSIIDNSVPDVALIDFGLPGMDGGELLTLLRSERDIGGCRFICVSGRQESEVNWRELGFDAYLQKPVEIEGLVSQIEALRRS
jgi:PAS domain S-box-containing protein